jgi:hypothetical protein
MKIELLNKIKKAAQARNKIRVRYLKTDGTSIQRVLAPYEYSDGYLFATDAKDKHSHIKTFVGDNVRSVVILKAKFVAKWPVKFDPVLKRRKGMVTLSTLGFLASALGLLVDWVFALILLILCLVVTALFVFAVIMFIRGLLCGQIVPESWLQKKRSRDYGYRADIEAKTPAEHARGKRNGNLN